MKTITTTFKVEDEGVTYLESYLTHYTIKMLNYKILPDTDKLYQTSPTFKKLVKAVKEAQKLRDEYINKMN